MAITEELIQQYARDPARLRLEIAILMYDHDVWSLRNAAKFAGIFWDDFSGILKERNIATGIFTEEEFERDLRTIERRRLLKR